MAYINLLTNLHNQTKRDYLKRVNDTKYPKHKAAKIAKKWSYDYWDGDRRICYGGYKYIPGRFKPLAKKLIKQYKLNEDSKVIDIGCGKGFLLYELKLLIPSIEICGIDISNYAIKNSKKEIKNKLICKNASNLMFIKDNYYDLAISLNTFHNLYCYDFEKALNEFSRISKKQYLVVESYRNEIEKQNLLYWQVTCEMFCSTKEWFWWFKKLNYNGDYGFIYFK
jgi:protein-L-isoaspartate(D-aspartate) O-methyltransferase